MCLLSLFEQKILLQARIYQDFVNKKECASERNYGIWKKPYYTQTNGSKHSACTPTKRNCTCNLLAQKLHYTYLYLKATMRAIY